MQNAQLIEALRGAVGKKHVLTGTRATERFRRGFRSGEGDALCVVRPGKLVELWRVLQACVEADKIVILQAANTGVTEGSTPKGTYDRDVVLINTRRMDHIELLHGGEQIVSFPGSTLFTLEKLLQPLGREPHSLIGSSCIGASIVGGVCNNSGGSLVERGPSYTEMSLYAQIDESGRLSLVNHLGIDLGDSPEEMLERLEGGDYDKTPAIGNLKASSTDYAGVVRQVDEDTPARFNADKKRLYEASGCAGKLAVFAVRLDTYETPPAQQTFFISTNDTQDLTDLRRHILTHFETLPVSAEYMERELFEMAKVYGKDTVMMVDRLGTDRLPQFFALKGAIDARLRGLGPLSNFTDRFMQFVSWITPNILPKRVLQFGDRYRHHLILKMRDGGVAEAETYLEKLFKNREGDYFACDDREAKIAGLHRFAAAGTAIRYKTMHEDEIEDVLALDVALRRNDLDWAQELPPHINEKIAHRLICGHFMCHVLHQDYLVKKGVDAKALKAELLEHLNQRGAEYPAEHNVGHLYLAKPDLADHYMCCDPTNSMNPGIGLMSRAKHYALQEAQ